MAAFDKARGELAELGVSVYAAAVDSEEQTREVADKGVQFPLGYGVTRDDADTIGAFWDKRRDCIQPSEFLVRRDGRILNSTYSSGPIGRTDPQDVVSLVGFIKSLRKKA